MTLIFSKQLLCRHSAFFLLLTTLLLTTYIIAECFFRQAFEAYSDEIAVRDQAGYKKSWFKFLEFMTDLGYGLPLSIIVIFYYEVSTNKLKAIVFIFLTTYLNYFMSILKMLYHQPRPYMRDPMIQPLFKCGEEWGNPSGHALCGMSFYFIVFNSLRKRLLSLQFAEDGDRSHDLASSPQQKLKNPHDIEMKEISNNNGRSKETIQNECEHKKDRICPNCKQNPLKRKTEDDQSLCEPCQSKAGCFGKDAIKAEEPVRPAVKAFRLFSNLFCYSFSLALIALIGYSRFFFGLHSINQVLLGWVYSITHIIYFYYFLTSDWLMSRCVLLLSRMAKYRQRGLRLVCCVYVTLGLVLFIMVPWVIFYVMRQQDHVDPWYLQNMREKCGQAYLDTHLLFFDNCFADIGTISIIFGILYGILLSSCNYLPEEFWPHYWQLPHWKKLLRMCFLGALAGLIYGLWALIKFPIEAYTVCFLNNGLKGMILGVLIVKILPKVYLRLGLDVRGDFMREKEE